MIQQSSRMRGPMSGIELKVEKALESLPQSLHVTLGGERIPYTSQGNSLRYEPDFVVRNDSGQTVVIEVKSPDALSLTNMVRFLDISTGVELLPQHAFLVLIWGAVDERSKRVAFKSEFSELLIRFVTTDSEVIRYVTEAFDSPALSN